MKSYDIESGHNINKIFMKQFVVTNCKYEKTRLNSNQTLRKFFLITIDTSKELAFYAAPNIKFIKFIVTHQKLRA